MEDACRFVIPTLRVAEHLIYIYIIHAGFSHREGIALSTITYNDDGEIRPIFYRMSLAEMVVPYGAPEFPHPRKFAFDR